MIFFSAPTNSSSSSAPRTSVAISSSTQPSIATPRPSQATRTPVNPYAGFGNYSITQFRAANNRSQQRPTRMEELTRPPDIGTTGSRSNTPSLQPTAPEATSMSSQRPTVSNPPPPRVTQPPPPPRRVDPYAGFDLSSSGSIGQLLNSLGSDSRSNERQGSASNAQRSRHHDEQGS